jgi:hypothetical protein
MCAFMRLFLFWDFGENAEKGRPIPRIFVICQFSFRLFSYNAYSYSMPSPTATTFIPRLLLLVGQKAISRY